jgi:hypothetical protein
MISSTFSGPSDVDQRRRRLGAQAGRGHWRFEAQSSILSGPFSVPFQVLNSAQR